MKKLLVIICVMFSFIGVAQEKKNFFFGGQLGILEGSIYNEFNLSTSFSFKSSTGLVGGIDGSGLFVYSKIDISPKWNYNINKRLSLNKNVKYNSSNYISLNVSYIPDWASLSDYKSRVIERVSVIPTFGVKRNFNKNMHYEFLIGIGTEYYLNTTSFNSEKRTVGIRIGALIGFDF